MLNEPVNFLNNLSLLIEFSILFSFSYTEISIKFMLHQMYFKIEEVFTKRNIEDFDSSTKKLTGFKAVKIQLGSLLQIIGRESLTSDNCNIVDLEESDIKLCKYFKDNIIGNIHFFKRYFYIITSFIILLISICQNTIDSTTLVQNKNWNNVLFILFALMLLAMIIRSIWLIYNSRRIGELLFNPDGILNKLIKEYNKTYDEFREEQKKEIKNSEQTAKDSNYDS